MTNTDANTSEEDYEAENRGTCGSVLYAISNVVSGEFLLVPCTYYSEQTRITQYINYSGKKI